MEYNTTRPPLGIREYGRHIQKMMDHILTIEDRKKRQEQAQVVIELMGFLNPHLKNVEDFRHKLWDHLFLISDFKLDVDSPYPIPTRETLKAKPQRLHYPKRYPKYNHLGKNIEVVINKALSEENPDKKQGFANAIAYYMKLSYNNWHKENVQDDTIQAELTAITKGELEFNNRPFVRQYRPSDDYRDNRGGGGKYKKHFQQRGGNGGRDNRGGGRDNRGGGGGKFKKRY
jgi:hypothetical protein